MDRCARQRAAAIGGVTVPWCATTSRLASPRPCRYEPGINRTYQDLATHYGTGILPTRPRTPCDKAEVEVGVLIIDATCWRACATGVSSRCSSSMQQADSGITASATRRCRRETLQHIVWLILLAWWLLCKSHFPGCHACFWRLLWRMPIGGTH